MRSKRDKISSKFWLTGLIAACLFSLLPILSVGNSPIRAFGQDEADLRRNSTVYLPLTLTGTVNQQKNQAAWLKNLNEYRSQAELPPVSENQAWSTGSRYHAIYTVKNDVLAHDEDENNQWFTPEGLIAARSGNLVASYDSSASDLYAIESWMQAPFHAIGILDPALWTVGYGSYREADGGLQMSATLDVLRGRGQVAQSVTFPIRWPGQGTTVSLGSFRSEHPNPLESCPGYSAPSGLPIILQIGPGNISPSVSGHAFYQGNTPLEHCVFDENTYENSDNSSQNLARSILDSRDAIVLIPKQPLLPGTTYTASITVNGESHTWSFRTAQVLR